VVAQLDSLGYECKVAASAADALEIMDDGWTADLLFTDVMMGDGMDGPELADAACKLKPDLKVLFTSGYTENAMFRHRRLDAGANLLSKPWRRDDLSSRLIAMQRIEQTQSKRLDR
jgi:CheY-like chemotaxis protein